MIFDDLDSALTNLTFGTSGAGRRLIIFTAGRGKTAAGLLKNHLTSVGNVEGTDALLTNLANACSGLHGDMSPLITCSMPSIGSGLNDQEKCLAYLNGIQSIINTVGAAADNVDEENVESVCLGLADAAAFVEQAAYVFMEG